MEMGYRKRSQFIRRWLEIGQDASVTEEMLFETVLNRERIISDLLGRNLFPSVPFFILILLQQIDVGVGAGAGSAVDSTYGHLYESMIKRNLVQTARSGPELDSKINYFAHLAFEMYDTDKKYLTQTEFDDWHFRFSELFFSKETSQKALRDAQTTSTLEVIEDSIAFRYPYTFQFFVAKYMADHIEDESIQKLVHTAFSNLHLRDSGNIVMFLGHLSKSPVIVDELLAVAEGLFEGIDEFDLASRPPLIDADVNMPRRILEIENIDPEKEREKLRTSMDEVERSIESTNENNAVTDLEVSDPEIEKATRFLREVNSSFRTVQMCGQILRNYYGTIEGERQFQLVKSSYSLGMKFSNRMFQFLE